MTANQEAGLELPPWWPTTFGLEIPEWYEPPVDEPQVRADYLISMAVVAKGLLMVSRGNALAAQGLFNEALSTCVFNGLARDQRDALRWSLESAFRNAASPDPLETEGIRQATELLRISGIDEGYFVMADGIVLRSYSLTHAGRQAAIAFADSLSRDLEERQLFFDQWQSEGDDFVTDVFEVGNAVRLIHEAEAV